MGKKKGSRGNAPFGDLAVDVAVIGAGASGMTAAITAAEAGANVAILEHTAQAGKKILATGNGRCNLGNLSLSARCWRSSDPSFVCAIPGIFEAESTLRFMERRGIVVTGEDGYCYPASGQAQSVRDVLVRDLTTVGARLITGCEISEIVRDPGGSFRIRTSLGDVRARAVILAAGSMAAPETGSDGSGYTLARALGHTMIKPLPALVQLRCEDPESLAVLREFAGIRLAGCIRLFRAIRESGEEAAEFIAEDTGEIQFTEYGISGIPAFQVSRFAARILDRGEKVLASLDFWPGESTEETAAFLRKRRENLGNLYSSEFLIGWLNRKIGDRFLMLAGIPRNIRVREIDDAALSRLLPWIRAFPLRVTGTNSFDRAQTCSGGVSVGEIDPVTMASGKVPGLYFAGEIMDVDGICGGYNLHFAWLTGQIAGREAAAYAKER